ncbi:MAG: hypothetical protein K8T26_04965 [Lentisphaerae bacterium]|nr:hypothetical protein [Lentisphaerota bacterium]
MCAQRQKSGLPAWRAGYGRREITPRVGAVPVGYFDDLRSTGVHDPLEVGVLCVQDEAGARSLLLAFDLGWMQHGAIEQLARAVQRATGIPRRLQMFNCSHTHSAPLFDSATPFADGQPWALAPDGGPYFPHVVRQTVEAVREAAGSLHPVHACAARLTMDTAVNRSVFTPEGRYHNFPCERHLLPLANGVVDQDLGLLLLYGLKGQALEYVVANYACHPLNAGGHTPSISADYVGVFRSVVRESSRAQALFLQGSLGNTHPRVPEGGYSAARRHGERLAEAVLGQAYSSRWGTYHADYALRAPEIRGRVWRYRFPLQEHNPAWYRVVVENPLVRPQVYRRAGKPCFRTALQVLQLGELALCGLPGELTAELSLQVKWNSPYRHTWMSGMATDYLGYLNHRHAYVHGGYEAQTSILQPAEGYRLADQFVHALAALHGTGA